MRRTHFMDKTELQKEGFETGKYFENNRIRNLDKRQFVFDSKRVNNSPYVLVRGKNHLELVKEGNPNELGFRHNGSINMQLSP